MTLPKKFIAKVKAEFPRHTALHEGLDAGDDLFVSNVLFDNSCLSVTPEQIIQAIRTGRSKTLLAKAETAVRISRLYKEFSCLAKK